jgi:hypothetical protein
MTNRLSMPSMGHSEDVCSFSIIVARLELSDTAFGVPRHEATAEAVQRPTMKFVHASCTLTSSSLACALCPEGLARWSYGEASGSNR